MGFKKLIQFKSLAGLLGLLLLMATNVVMAQDATADAAKAATQADAAKSSMWLGVGYYVLLVVLIGIIVGIVGKILRVYDLTLQIQRKKPINWNNFLGWFFIVFLVVGFYGAYWEFTNQGTLRLPEAASLHGVKMDNMFMVTFAITVAVFFITQFLLFTFVFKYKNKEGKKAYYYPHNNTIEKIWTLVPAIVLTVLVVTGFFTWHQIMDSTKRTGDVEVDLTAHQFAWEIRYPGKDGLLGPKKYTLVTANNKLGLDFSNKSSFDDLVADTIVIPVNKPVRLNVIAQDVIHSMYMPHFRAQINAVPGLPTFFRFVPTITTEQMRAKLDDPKFEYLLYCNKICGGSHYNMQRVVRVVTEGEYQAWIAKQKPYLNDALKKDLKLIDTTKTDTAAGMNKLALNY